MRSTVYLVPVRNSEVITESITLPVYGVYFVPQVRYFSWVARGCTLYEIYETYDHSSSSVYIS